MFLQTVCLLLLTTYSYADDFTIYRTCSEVELCRENRELERQNRYEVLLEGAIFYQGLATFRVRNTETGDDNTLLNITAVEGNTFRVQIEERDSERYHISYALDGEPRIIDFDDVQLSLNSAEIVVGKSRAVVYFSPFNVEFYNGDTLAVVVEGDRLTLQNEELHTPFTISVNFTQATHLYGLAEHADHLALRTTQPGEYDPYRLKTIDSINYELYSTMAMYGTIPVIYGHASDITAGIFLHNAAEQWVEITDGENAYFMVDSGALDLFVFLGPTITDVVKQYTSLTGLPHMPPLWTLGYHQCRWGYANQEEIETVVSEFDANDFPIDVMWLDVQHMENMKFFTWNSENYSHPVDMLENLSATNRYVVAVSDCHFKQEEGYFAYDEFLELDYFVKSSNGSVFIGDGWPGASAWVDYLNPEAREYYSDMYSYERWNGTTPTLGGVWNDMNEVSIFDNDTEKTFPYDVVHYGGVSNRDVHNLYGHLQLMSTHKGLMDRDNGTRRPFILTRSHFAGSQRYAAFWTGDNTADFGYINISFSMCLNANLLGLVFCGADVGGFFQEPDDELIQRFYQSGAWLPFFREHSTLESERREPFVWPEEVQGPIREAMKTRYAHLPVWYTLFYEHTRTSAPVIRPLFYEYPQDSETFEIDDQLLLGSDILVKAVAEAGVESVRVYFPGGIEVLWFSALLDGVYYPGTGWTDVQVTIDRIPVFYRLGSIIPTKQIPRPTTTDMIDDPYTLYVFPDASGSADGTVYIDDNLSFEYRESLRYNYVSLATDGDNVVFSSIDDSDAAGFELAVDQIIVVSLNGSGEYVKTSYKYSADGTLLKELKFRGKEPLRIRLN